MRRLLILLVVGGLFVGSEAEPSSVLSSTFTTPEAGAGVAAAVSSGGYDPAQQDCSPGADAWNTAASTEPGCHNYKLNVEDGSGHRYAEFGIDQLKQDLNAHSGSYEVNTNDGGAGVSGAYDTNYQPIPPGGPSEFGLFFYPAQVALCAVTT